MGRRKTLILNECKIQLREKRGKDYEISSRCTEATVETQLEEGLRKKMIEKNKQL